MVAAVLGKHGLLKKFSIPSNRDAITLARVHIDLAANAQVFEKASSKPKLLIFFKNPYRLLYQLFFSAFAAVAFFVFAGRLLPNEPLKIFPFFVFLSPLPMVVVFL
jgi:hypothetical protein